MDEKIVKDSQSLAKELVNDCISREAVLDFLQRRLYHPGYNEGELNIIRCAIGEVQNLPAIEPKTTESGSVMHETAENEKDRTTDDCISRQAAIDAVDAIGHIATMPDGDKCVRRSAVKYTLSMLPSAQPETAERTTEMAQNVSDGDLISRKAAMNRIDEALARVFKEPCGELILRKVPSAQPEQQWIPCSERLPEEKDAGILKKLGTEKRSEYVLATVEVKGERTTVTACTHDGKWDWNMKYAFPDYKVVAWMPLPEPAKLVGD